MSASLETAGPTLRKKSGMIPLGDVTEARVEQIGPQGREFTYVDIGSINRDTKRIVDPKVLPSSKAPSRAKQLLQAGDVLVSMTRPNLNAVALVPPDLDGAIGSTGFHVLRARDAEPGFLFYAVQSSDFIDAMCLKVQGALSPAVRPRDISSFNIPRSSLAQQRRIVAEIEKQFTRLEAGVAALRRVQANLKRYRAAVLKAACEGKLVTTDAGSWREVTLDDVCSKITDGEHQTPKRQLTGRMLLSAKNVRNGYIDYEDHDLISEEDFYKCRTRCDAQPNDILIVCVGATIGRTAIVRDAAEFALVRSVALLRPRDLEAKYLLFVIQSDIGQNQIAAVKRGSAQACLYLHRIRATRIPLPPLAEQTRIVAEVERRLSLVEELEAMLSANLQRATRLRQSILQKAFTGDLV